MMACSYWRNPRLIRNWFCGIHHPDNTTFLSVHYTKSKKNTFSCGYDIYYDSTTDDYKIILIYNLFYVVYSTSKNIWTNKITLPTLQQCLPEFELSTSYTYMCSRELTLTILYIGLWMRNMVIMYVKLLRSILWCEIARIEGVYNTNSWQLS